MKQYLVILIIIVLPLFSYTQDLLGGEIRLLGENQTDLRMQAKIYTDASMGLQRNFIIIEVGGLNLPVFKTKDTLLTPNIRLSEYERKAFLSFNISSAARYIDSLDGNRIANVQDTSDVLYVLWSNISTSLQSDPESPNCIDIMNAYSIIDDTLYYQINCQDSANSFISYNIEPILHSTSTNFTIPTDVSIDTSTGLITWANPPDSGLYWFTIRTFEFEALGGFSEMFRLQFFDFDDPVPLLSNNIWVDQHNFLQVFPNPAQDLLNIQFDYYKPINTQIQLFNMAGQLVLQQTMKQKREQLNIADLASGVYMVRVIAGKKVWTQKVIKE